MKDKLFINYMMSVNYLESEDRKPFKNKLSRKVDKIIIMALGLSVGLMTIKVAIEQLIMQWRL